MHLFQTTFDAISAKLTDLNNMMKRLQTDLDGSIHNTCGQLTYPDTHSRLDTFFCDFEDDICSFTKLGTYGWSRGQGAADRTTGSTLGHYLVSGYTDYRYKSGMVTKEFDTAKEYCIRFFYRSNINYNGIFEVFLRQGNSGYPVFHRDTATTLWELAEISPDPEYLRQPFQIEVQEKGTGYILIDDFAVYKSPCSSPGIRFEQCSPPSYSRIHGQKTSCYTFVMTPMTYLEGVKFCRKMFVFSSLLAIETDIEHHYIMDIIKNNTDVQKSASFGLWLRGNDIDAEHAFVYMEDQPKPVKSFNYTNWHPGQPNNIGGNQDCMALLKYGNEYQWGDEDCSYRKSFFCEAEFANSDIPNNGMPAPVVGK